MKKVRTLKSKAFKSWCKIKERCYNPNCSDFYMYGAVGIKMHPDFKESFQKFYEYIGDPPELSSLWSVDRINSKEDYTYGNIRWANATTQSRNRSKQKNNTSGFHGVQIYWSGNPKHTTYVIATWSDGVGTKPRNKKFSCRKLGLIQATYEAVKFRKEKIEELKSLGFDYSDTHGT